MARKSHSAHCATFQQRTSPNLAFGMGEWYGMYGGIWQVIPELAVRRNLHNSMLDDDHLLTNSDVTSVLALLKAQVYVPDDRWDGDPNLLAFADGVLNIATRKFGPHKPEYYLTSKLPFAYDPKATSPVWDKFLADTIPEAAEFLQEFAGYCATTATRYETAVWLYGPPGGGKSTFVEGLLAMLGHRACVLGLSDLENSAFALTNLPGRTLAISTEQPSHFIKSPHILNAIISGEPVNVNRKYRDMITIVPRCKLLWAMNELPRIDERGSGLFRRIKLVHFPAIPAENRDPAVKEQIAQSGMAITNWALAGLDRLQKRGRFDIPAIIADATETYRITNDIPQLFLDDCTERIQGERTQSSSLYAAYCAWCGANGHRATSSTRFADEMTRLGLTKFKYGTVYWQDVKLIPAPESPDAVIDSYVAEESGPSN